MGITESWLNSSISNCEISVEGCDILRYDRDLGGFKRGGGGILVYAVANHTFEHLESWSLRTPDLEWVWSVMKLPHTRPTYLCTLYRPPTGNIDNFLELLETRVMDIYALGTTDIVILGDVNINMSDICNCQHKKYANTLSVLHLTQLIEDPTHVTNSNSSLIDHVLVNRPEMYYQHGTIEIDISDHSLVYAA